MKHRITSAIAAIVITCGMLLSLPSSVATAAAAKVATADTGQIFLGPGQKLRLTIAFKDGTSNTLITFKRMFYSYDGPAGGGVRKTALAFQDTSAPLMLAGNEGATIEISQDGFDAVRGVVQVKGLIGTDVSGARVTGQIFNSAGEVQSVLIALLIP